MILRLSPLLPLFVHAGVMLVAGAVLSTPAALAQQAVGKPAAAAGAVQTPGPAPAPVPSEPGMTTASFGDWTLRCQRLELDGKAGRVCEVSQTMQVQGQAAPIAQVAIGRLKPTEPLRITVVLPVSIAFPSSVQIDSDDKDVKPVDLPWRRCVSSGCFADNAVEEDALKRWRSASQAGRIVFKDSLSRELTIPLSFRGIGPALDALAKERF